MRDKARLNEAALACVECDAGLLLDPVEDELVFLEVLCWVGVCGVGVGFHEECEAAAGSGVECFYEVELEDDGPDFIRRDSFVILHVDVEAK